MKHFSLYELVDRKTYDSMGAGAWSLFQPDALLALDDLRKFFGVSLTVNTWHEGGSFEWRGYRTPEKAAALGAPNSQHRYGNAFDLDVSGMTAQAARGMIIFNQNHPLLRRIMRLEKDVSWVHFDLLPVPRRIRLF